MAVELRNRLNRALAGRFVAPSTIVFDYPNSRRLASRLRAGLSERGDESAPEVLEPGEAEAPPGPLSAEEFAEMLVGLEDAGA